MTDDFEFFVFLIEKPKYKNLKNIPKYKQRRKKV
jgi:hypothetical protein